MPKYIKESNLNENNKFLLSVSPLNLRKIDVISALPSSHLVFSEEIYKGLNEVDIWIKSYLAKSNPQLGRYGPVCPFIPSAIKKNKLSMTYVIHDKSTTEKKNNLKLTRAY